MNRASLRAIASISAEMGGGPAAATAAVEAAVTDGAARGNMAPEVGTGNSGPGAAAGIAGAGRGNMGAEVGTGNSGAADGATDGGGSQPDVGGKPAAGSGKSGRGPGSSP